MMMKPIIIDTLKQQGLITDTIGSLPNNEIKPAFVVWARSEPKESFRGFIALSKYITTTPLTVYVDDVFSILVTKRGSAGQAQMNEKYTKFFESRGCIVKFSSVLYSEEFSDNVFPAICDLGRRTLFGEFIRCLPEDKRQDLTGLFLDETLHSLFELFLLERVATECNLLLVGHFCQAIVFYHRKTSSKYLPAMAIPRLGEDVSIEDYEKKLLNLR